MTDGASISTAPTEDEALALDRDDPLASFRDQFALPPGPDGAPLIYFCGNSLGVQPRAARGLIEQEMDDWARLGVEGHHHAATPWYSYHEVFRETGARLVGARPGEVVMMNSLTVNLHLMMVSFYRPAGARRKILIDWPCFPSDVYAVKTHLRSRGIDPDDALVILEPRAGEHVLRTEDVVAHLRDEGDAIALVLFAGVNFLTGQAMDVEAITAAAHAAGAIAGWDLAHAAGNLDLRLHDWNVDFACWCSYKYLNAGPGAIAGCFVHERHGANTDLPRYGGWWGNDPATRFRMQLEPAFVAKPDADGWQCSNPPILAMAPLRASLDLFDRAGMPALRAKSLKLTGFLRRCLEADAPRWLEIITPREDDAHGAQLSLLVHDAPRERFAALERIGAVGDFREPNVIRVAPTPLYNTFHEAWRFAAALRAATS